MTEGLQQHPPSPAADAVDDAAAAPAAGVSAARTGPVPSRRARWARTSARVVVGTAAAAGFALAVGALATAPLPGHRASAVGVEALPTPSDAVAVCAGPLLAAGREQSDAALLGAAADQSVTAMTGSGAAPASVLLAGPAAGSGPTAFVVPPEGRTVAELGAAGSASVAADDLSGFAAAACLAPAFESWLVAGSAATGAADLVTLANPGAVAATVTVTVYGTSGPTTAPGGTDVVVAPGAQVSIPLAGLRLGESGPVLRVTATGAPVTAVVQSSIVRTLLPGGVEQTAATGAPDGDVVIPGVVVPEGIVPGAEPATVLRLLAPSADAAATVMLTRADGGEAPAPQQVALLAGQPLQVDLGTLAPGVWTVEVTSDAAVAAAVRQATGFAEGADFAWFEAAPELSGVVLAAVAAGPSPVLNLANPSPADVSVTVTAAGAATDVVVPAGGAAVLPVAGGSVLTLDAGDAVVHAAISYASAGTLSGYPVPAGAGAAAAVLVHP